MKDAYFHKENPNDLIWQVETLETLESIGMFLFSFDKKTIFNFWEDYPKKLTSKQIEIFKKEYPELAKLK